MDIPALMLLLAISLIGVGVLEYLSRHTKLPAAVIRKSGHAGLALILAGAAIWLDQQFFVIGGVMLCVIASIVRQLPLRSLATFKKSSYGELFFPLGIALAALIASSSTHFIACLLLLGLADTAAYYFGRRIRSPRLVGNKTVAGTLAFGTVSALIIWWTTGSLSAAFLLAIPLSLVELMSQRGSDNVTVPVVTACLLLPFS